MRQNVEVRDVNGILVDPDTIVITILDTKETVKVNAEVMTKESAGKYMYDYLIATDAELGKWVTEIKAVSGFTAIEQDEFAVMEGV